MLLLLKIASTKCLIPDIVSATGVLRKPLVMCPNSTRDDAGGILEVNCISIDVCTEKNEREQSVASKTWHNRKDYALRFSFESESTESTESEEVQYVQHALMLHNIASMRVSRGVTVKVCAPDFAVLRETGEYQCNIDTIETVVGNCMFLNESTCQYAPQTSPACTQMFWYEIQAGWACNAQDDVQPGFQLSSVTQPNYMMPCPVINPEAVKYTTSCDFVCKVDYVKDENGVCQSRCSDKRPACEPHERASDTCTLNDGTRLYTCEHCQVALGFQLVLFADRSQKSECTTTPCEAGFYGREGQCLSCPEHEYSNTSAMSVCVSCPWGTHQPSTGSSECLTCFQNTVDVSCGDGIQKYFTLESIEQYFHSVKTTAEFAGSILTISLLRTFCQQGYACLPCPPGSYEHQGICTACATGTYQPHFKSTACFQCSEGLTTVTPNATRSSDCVCQPGFE
jgi:hypothetical protein